ncbi:MAG: glycosyltransferase family 4 protein [Mesorhizobium sp.]|nr:glycosyltransferase family 1 protein [bacterium M00.F.Ca.ET.205.01.1.1]TGU50999.1 glycosyltransferase family 1 protein [bacterium M00.F.Ca.ET.152.01.1.1]TGV34488.1 glycosyltransferase family 1 protein [Mesorhizobium sp. M00.F.Ca.ET.186.01.1.1]TGZ41843.1 glycosyltransferase family 1 protein [bacterium M00.F.Ca.ET.162.01.1.1]TIW62611.1 MAG: glycosyltransferase family 4 protein [Mesorhizobium sp.]
MKIGIDARNLVPGLTGIGRYVVEMTRALVAAGHRPILYLPEPPANGLVDLKGADMRVAGFRGAVARMIWSQTALPRAAAGDAVDVFWGPAHRLPFRLPAPMPRVVTIHDLVWAYAPETMRWQTWGAERIFAGAAVRRADAIVVDSDATMGALRQRYPGLEAPVTTIYPGYTRLVPGDIEAVRTRFGIDRTYLLFVGTLEPRKNLVRLLEAWAGLGSAVRSGHLLVIAGGQGWHLGDLRSHLARLKISDQVRLTGYLDDNDLASLYAGARALTMPSLYEGFGLPILEANGFGVPVLTSNISSMPEIAGEGALLVDPLSVSDLTAKLHHLLTDDRDLARRAAIAKANAARFDWHASAERLLEVFDQAAAKRKGR